MVIKKIFFGGLGSIFLATASLMLYAMTQMDMVHLMLCSTNQGGTQIPSSLCKYYLINYRINEKGIKELSEGGGLDVVLNVENNATEYELAKLFLANGLDINGINHYGGIGPTPLQGAVANNDVPRLKFLIAQGADLHNTGGMGMTALALAIKLHKETKLHNRSEIIRLLSEADHTDSFAIPGISGSP